MRRLMFITAFALFFTLPLCAQRGGHAGGGFHGGLGGARGFAHGGLGAGGMRGGFSRGFHSSGFSRGPHSPGLSRGFRSRGFSRGPYLHAGFRRDGFRRDGFRRDRFHHRFHGFGNNCWGWGCRGFGYPWWGWGYYDPWLWDWWNDDYSFDQDYNQNLAIANEMDQQSLAQQRMWRQEQADIDQDSYAPTSSDSRSTPANNDIQTAQVASPTILVFRDQHEKEIHNYAIVGQTLWNFAPQKTEKIPLADLDVAATVKANEDRGITFTIPGSGEGQ